MMRETVINFFRALPQFEPGKKILCALSGGGDSVALLCLLNEVREELGIRLGAAHFNHCLRATADRDEKYARHICADMGIEFFAGRGDVKSAAQGKSVEETARDMRYAFLMETARSEEYDYIATAHTADDNLETMILNLIRGSGTKGLSGIPPVRGTIIRPLLSFTGVQLREYLMERNIDYMDDETNFQNICARNELRLNGIPVLKGINSRAAENASGAALRLRKDEEFLDNLAEEHMRRLVTQTPRGAEMSIKELLELHESVSSRIILKLCPQSGSEHVASVLKLCRSNRASGEASLPAMVALREYDCLIIGEQREMAAFEETEIDFGVTHLSDMDIILEHGRKIYNSEMTFYLKHSNIQGKLYARSRRIGDRIKLPRRPDKSLKKLMIDEKIPHSERDSLLVVQDDEGIVLVERLGVSERCVGEDLTLTICRK